ncbi:FAD-binding oxidoreductase [Roseobacter denitrificans]|uniref:Fructosyl-amino acid oxidase, putative n=1 Tax=Roseobacter denitrificans (strain ATCC 33942 / OCh 114) TaxID=375451 RepID=Q164E1_ROSDO|nr:FAD-dependent oxidoreductase [Roseobacter denitrificans]ABG32652.1 fructosyl-amino acid oxidase, putative [Roseobacter denitrificans OCh 114]AVL52087.1 FAD-binding oxidoreductase [Roseobacter denitrificans]SFF93284.1 Glycine/D-amino acid oxidase [Roseobacter denitrificans OCh 114]
MKVVIVGAGIIGALSAFHLARRGADVTVIEAGQPANAASGASFGWINASFFHDRNHFDLRFAAMSAHRRLADILASRATVWQGCLSWEDDAGIAAQYDMLKSYGYAVSILEQKEIAALEPSIAAPPRALHMHREGAVDLATLAHDALTAATALGARVIAGVAVTRLEHKGEHVQGVRWSGGTIPADAVLLATGVATQGLLADVGQSLPMLTRPALIVRSAPIALVISHILVTPGQEVRQDTSGRILAPTSASHQSDSAEAIDENPQVLADRAVARVSDLLGQSLTWEQVTLAHRPVPQDGLPVVGASDLAGLYVSTMHSGATLAPLVSEIAAKEVLAQALSNEEASLIAPYRPQRFTA